jgi:prolyl oligopeptidase
MIRSAKVLSTLCILSLSGLAFAAPPAMPATEKKPVEDKLHGKTIVDNYRWLEGDNSDEKNMGKVTPEVSAWTDKQNDYTRAVLDALPGRRQLEEKLRPLMEIGSVSAPIMRGNYYFYTKREGKENQPRIFVREGATGSPRVLLDLTQVDYTGLTALGGMVPSQDGKFLAVGLYRSGDENTTVYIIETATGE